MTLSNQLPLFGATPDDDPAIGHPNGLFLAALPDDEARDHALEIGTQACARYRLRGPLRPRRVLHSTLVAFKGSYESPTDLADLVGRLAVSLSTFPSFRVVFDQAGSFGQRESRQNRYPFVLTGRGDGIAGIGALQSRLAALMPKWVPVERDSTKTPHMTLMYDARWIATYLIEPVAWTVREFVLVHSLIGKTQHVILRRFPLCSLQEV